MDKVQLTKSEFNTATSQLYQELSSTPDKLKAALRGKRMGLTELFVNAATKALGKAPTSLSVKRREQVLSSLRYHYKKNGGISPAIPTKSSAAIEADMLPEHSTIGSASLTPVRTTPFRPTPKMNAYTISIKSDGSVDIATNSAAAAAALIREINKA